jgi:hypothetical protein
MTSNWSHVTSKSVNLKMGHNRSLQYPGYEGVALVVHLDVVVGRVVEGFTPVPKSFYPTTSSSNKA